jgi:hypothetical protein
MKRLLSPLLLASLALALTGCVGPSGPDYSMVKDTFPALKADSARLFIYRPDSIGAMYVPGVKINDGEAVQTVPHGFFYVDLPPGDYQISTGWHAEEMTHIHLEAGQVRYVRMNLSADPFGMYLDPKVVGADTALSEIATCGWAKRW